jgi:hypothetical protein
MNVRSAKERFRAADRPHVVLGRRVLAVDETLFLIGAVFLLPVILMYTGRSYWVFRGEVRGDLGYH